MSPYRKPDGWQARLCTVGGCMRVHKARGYCSMHYQRFVKGAVGGAAAISPRGLDVVERFEMKFAKGSPDECWEWNGARVSASYGSFGATPGKPVSAHRFSYETYVGPIPDGLLIRHKCDNPPCVNPSHLETGTDADNMRDRSERGRHWAQRHPEMIKISDAEVRVMRSEWDSGDHPSLREMAEARGISATYASGIVNRRVRTRA